MPGGRNAGGVKKDRQSAGKGKDRFEDYKEEIEKIPDLSSLPRLHDLITKVRAKREENHDKLELLGAAYNQLKDNIKVVRDEQNNTANTATAVADTKVEEKKK